MRDVPVERLVADDGHGITHILCSPLSRAHETAQIIAAETGLPFGTTEVSEITDSETGQRVKARPTTGVES